MEVEKLLNIKQKIENENKKQTDKQAEIDAQPKKRIIVKRKVYEANTSDTTKACIYQTSNNEFYLIETENEDKFNVRDLCNDENKLTLEQAIELGGENIESFFKEAEIVKNGTLLRGAKILNLTAGYYETRTDVEAYECNDKCYFIKRIYEVVGEVPNVDRTWWDVKEDEAPKVQEVSRQEMENKLGRTVEELKKAREIWEKGKVVEGTDTSLKINEVKKFEDMYAGCDKENSYDQYRLMTEKEVEERINELNPKESSQEELGQNKASQEKTITIKSLREQVSNYLKRFKSSER